MLLLGESVKFVDLVDDMLEIGGWSDEELFALLLLVFLFFLRRLLLMTGELALTAVHS